MGKSLPKFLATILVGIGIFSSSAVALERSVDCDKGQSIQEALNKTQSSAEPLVISVTGTCDEIVTIQRDNVTIDGNDKAGTIEGDASGGFAATINVNGGSDSIRIHGLKITGTNVGVTVRGGNTWISDSEIYGNPTGGLFVLRNSRVAITNTTVRDNGNIGVYVEASLFEPKQNSKIIDNDAADGLVAGTGAIVITRDTEISRNGADGIYLNLHSVAELLGSSTVSDNGNGVILQRDSALVIGGPLVTVSDDITCNDDESSFANDGVEVMGDVFCTGF